MSQAKRAELLPGTKTIEELLRAWSESKFTGIAIFNVHLGIPHSVEFGRPYRLEINHDELLRKFSLTEKDPSS